MCQVQEAQGAGNPAVRHAQHEHASATPALRLRVQRGRARAAIRDAGITHYSTFFTFLWNGRKTTRRIA